MVACFIEPDLFLLESLSREAQMDPQQSKRQIIWTMMKTQLPQRVA